jgi:hypothetical protein
LKRGKSKSKRAAEDQTVDEGLGEVVSVSIPDLLFEKLSFRKPSGNVPHLPVANHPSFDP